MIPKLGRLHVFPLQAVHNEISTMTSIFWHKLVHLVIGMAGHVCWWRCRLFCWKDARIHHYQPLANINSMELLTFDSTNGKLVVWHAVVWDFHFQGSQKSKPPGPKHPQFIIIVTWVESRHGIFRSFETRDRPWLWHLWPKKSGATCRQNCASNVGGPNFSAMMGSLEASSIALAWHTSNNGK